VRITLHDSVAALETLGRYLGIFPARGAAGAMRVDPAGRRPDGESRVVIYRPDNGRSVPGKRTQDS
jgi:hypothetical protein